MKKVVIRDKAAKNIRYGHPWCFSGAIEMIDPGLQDGDLCELYNQNQFIGVGYFNSRSDITIRIITRKKQSVDSAFFVRQFAALKKQKEARLENTNAYRLVFAESDNLPGLIVDKYADVLVVQIHTLGMEMLKPAVVEALIEVMKPFCIYERSDISVRRKEGLDPRYSALLHGELPDQLVVRENGFKFQVDVVAGQKTGLFLDQRENRLVVRRYASGRNVLNCFSYTGGFSIYAAAAAKAVTSVDISAPAIDTARKNFELNNIDPAKHSFAVSDVFDFLKNIEAGQFDFIIIDPPSMSKQRDNIKQAIKAYTTLNTFALSKLPDYGFLATCSCTAHLDELTFIKILNQAAISAGCQVKVIEARLQPFDHAYNLNFIEGRYLKFYLLQKWPVL